ncbi:MAG: DUF378 domain-containing protein [Chlamydiae bacterium]|jgi:uncharacterized membrane protein YuzA (DUF378 family)|nr:DUF378 domain-containing protein [Chlamydiota bacterium]
MKTLDLIVIILLIIGGLNWGLVGLFNFNLVDTLFGFMSPVSRVIYTVVGLGAAYRLLAWNAICKRCKKK